MVQSLITVSYANNLSGSATHPPYAELKAGGIVSKYPPKKLVGQDVTILQRIGKLIRSADTTANEKLPKRWVELIQHLDEKEQRQEDRNERERKNR